MANSNRCLPNPPPPLVATTRTRGVRVVSTGATGLASRRTPASVSNHHVAPPFPQGARRCSASAPLGVGSRRAAAIPGGECTHPQFVHGRGHAPAFGRFAHVSPSPLVARQSEFCGSRPSLSLGRCAMCGVRDYISVRSSVRSLSIPRPMFASTRRLSAASAPRRSRSRRQSCWRRGSTRPSGRSPGSRGQQTPGAWPSRCSSSPSRCSPSPPPS